MSMLKSLWNEERGQGMTEYGLILALLVIGVITIMSAMGTNLTKNFTAVSDALKPKTP